MQNQIPVSTKPFFQEYTFSHLNPRKHASLVIERILTYGDRAEVRWVFDFYGVDRLRKWVAENGLRLLPKRRYYLWCLVLDLKPKTAVKNHPWTH